MTDDCYVFFGNEETGMNESSQNDKALIFDIERFSTADGPGIRTVVFFKGCNMRCYWCHNPEGIDPEIRLRFDEGKCIGCMACFKACQSNAHSISEGHHIIDAEKCVRCFACADACYSGALQRVGRYMSLDEVFAEINEDRDFYARSGGGVTLSGGEVMLQSDFAARLLKRCKQNGIHTAIESNMLLPWAVYQKILADIDLVMADIKHLDDAAHRRGTGVSNRRVLSNIHRLTGRNVSMIIRTPVIPGFNDTEDNIRQTALFLQPFASLRYYELLSYNPLGNSKGCIVGDSTPQREIAVPTREQMHTLAGVAAEAGIRLFVDGHEYTIKNESNGIAIRGKR
jgi:glycyl-radical enzyme activating protein